MTAQAAERRKNYTAVRRQLILLEFIRDLNGPDEVNATWDILQTALRRFRPRHRRRTKHKHKIR